MADKKQKKPRHTGLVLPGETGKANAAPTADRLGRAIPPAAAQQPEAPAMPEQAEGAPAEAPKAADGAPAPAARPAPQQPEKNAADKEDGRAPKDAAGEETAEADSPDTDAPTPAKDAKPKKRGRRKPRKLPKRKPNHAALAVPATAAKGAAPPPEDDPLPPGAIRMPTPKRKPKKLSPIKRRRRRRRIQALVLAVLVVAGILFYQTGAYLTFATRAADLYESLLIAARPGDGFPMDFAISGFVKTEPMADNGLAVLGEKEMALISSSGRDWRVQHNYMTPGLSAGNTRVVLYSRGGREYTVEGRTRTIAEITTPQDISFCEMSPDGWLAVVTSSRFSSRLTVLDPTYNTAEPLFQFPMDVTEDGLPVLASFHSDNKRLLLGCVSASSGALGSTIYLLHTGKDTIQGVIRVEDARLLRAEYLPNGRILAVYDRFTAIYDANGEEQTRHSYGSRRLLSSDVGEGTITLVFGSSSQETAHALLMNNSLQPLCEVSVQSSATPVALATAGRLYLLAGQQLLAYNHTGAALGSLLLDARPYTIARGGAPLLLAAGSAYNLDDLFGPSEDASSPSAAAFASAAAPASAPVSASPASDAAPDSYDQSMPLAEP